MTTNKTLVFLAMLVLLFNAGCKDSSNSQMKGAKDPGKTAEWASWKATLEKNALPCLEITLKNAKPTTIHQSKFGGKPYWPKEMPYPRDTKGKPMFFLAQMNFSEVKEMPTGYPSKGLLQFFVGIGDLYGADFVDDKNTVEKYLRKEKDFAVIYHPVLKDVDPALDKDVLAILKSREGPLRGEAAVTLSFAKDLATPNDYRFEKITRSLGSMSDEIEEFAYNQSSSASSHKVGGYAFFTQWDPRGYYAKDQEWLLLFQMNSESNDHIDIMWGDAGVANFFIRPKDLSDLRFNNVWYNWDCY